MEFSWNPNTKCTEKPQSSISTHPFSDVPSFSKISQSPGQNQKNGNSVVYQPFPSRLASRIHPFIFFKTL